MPGTGSRKCRTSELPLKEKSSSFYKQHNTNHCTRAQKEKHFRAACCKPWAFVLFQMAKQTVRILFPPPAVPVCCWGMTIIQHLSGDLFVVQVDISSQVELHNYLIHSTSLLIFCLSGEVTQDELNCTCARAPFISDHMDFEFILGFTYTSQKLQW